MRITVAICTWNRCKLLRQTLEHLRNLRLPAEVDLELLVVNNACTDETDDIIEEFAQLLPLRRLYEAKQGHSHARNCAIDAATGDWILWTDDDVIVDPGWIRYYFDAICLDSTICFAGGNIEPWFEADPPFWLTRHFDKIAGAYATIRRERIVRELGSDESLFGANMAFRTSVLKELRFNPELGLVGSNPMRGDETELLARLRAAGGKGLWVGTACVRHFIPKERLTTNYLWRFFFGYGQALVRLKQKDYAKTLLGYPRWALRSYLQSQLIRFVFSQSKNSVWIDHFRIAATCAGYLFESRKNNFLS